MRRSMILLAVGLGGCLLPSRRDSKGFVAEGVADSTSFPCARNMVAALDYSVMARDDSAETLTAVRSLGRASSERLVGYLNVSVARDGAAPRLVVSGERRAEGGRVTRPGDPTPVPPTRIPEPGFPQPIPERPRHLPIVRLNRAHQVSPGEVATHARRVVQECALGGEARTAE
jgi:hypothetical protein